jgi:hypothetical protein
MSTCHRLIITTPWLHYDCGYGYGYDHAPLAAVTGRPPSSAALSLGRSQVLMWPISKVSTRTHHLLISCTQHDARFRRVQQKRGQHAKRVRPASSGSCALAPALETGPYRRAACSCPTCAIRWLKISLRPDGMQTTWKNKKNMTRRNLGNQDNTHRSCTTLLCSPPQSLASTAGGRQRVWPAPVSCDSAPSWVD